MANLYYASSTADDVEDSYVLESDYEYNCLYKYRYVILIKVCSRNITHVCMSLHLRQYTY